MTPLTVNPRVILQIELDGKGFLVIKAVGTNICPDLQIEMVDDDVAFTKAAGNVPFKDQVKYVYTPILERIPA